MPIAFTPNSAYRALPKFKPDMKTKPKEKEIELLKKDIELKELQFQKQRSNIQVLVSVSLLLLAIFLGAILIIGIVRKKQATSEKQ